MNGLKNSKNVVSNPKRDIKFVFIIIGVIALISAALCLIPIIGSLYAGM